MRGTNPPPAGQQSKALPALGFVAFQVEKYSNSDIRLDDSSRADFPVLATCMDL